MDANSMYSLRAPLQSYNNHPQNLIRPLCFLAPLALHPKGSPETWTAKTSISEDMQVGLG